LNLTPRQLLLLTTPLDKAGRLIRTQSKEEALAFRKDRQTQKARLIHELRDRIAAER
jgi:hypothetical protein